MNENNQILPRLKLSVQRALLGMITPQTQAVSVEHIGLQKIVITFYLDQYPTKSDFENLSEVMAEVLADIEFEEVEENCEYTDNPIPKLSNNAFFVYLRKS